MKKTFALLLALAGVAAAVETPSTIDGKQFNQDLVYYLNQDLFSAGDSFSMSFTIKAIAGFDNQQKVMTLGTGDKNLLVWSQSSTYIGLTTTSDPHTWHDGEWTRTDGVNYITFEAAPNCWISKSNTGANAAPGFTDSQWTITYDGANTTIELQVGTCHDIVTINNYAMDLNQFSVLEGNADGTGARVTQIADAVVTYNGKTHNLMTPEPATATLSLLALAGLAARRRRH